MYVLLSAADAAEALLARARCCIATVIVCKNTSRRVRALGIS